MQRILKKLLTLAVYYKHKNDAIHHYLIFIKPAIEVLILENVKSVNISIADFNLSNNLQELTKRSKTITSKFDSNFKNLFKILLSKKVNNIVILAEWIKYLKEYNYKINIDELISLTNELKNRKDLI